MDSDTIVGVSVFGLIVAIIAAILIFPFIGIHVNTGHGQHTGYVTAVEQNGLFFKTWRAYVKTDTQSSQEDQYCITDPTVIDQLTKAVDTKEHVTVSYFSWLSAGITNCDGEPAIINAVTPVSS